MFCYEAFIDWEKDNGVIEWDRVHISDGWNQLTDKEKDICYRRTKKTILINLNLLILMLCFDKFCEK